MGEHIMLIENVTGITNNGEFTTITTGNTIIHLPTDGIHHITIASMKNPGDNYVINIKVDFYVE